MAITDLLIYVGHNWAIFTALLFTAHILHTRYQKGLHKIPGPRLRSISPLPRIWSVYKGNSHNDDLDLHKKYGKVVRIAPNTISISDTSEIDHIYGITTKFYKSRFYDPVRFYDDEGLIPDPFVLTNKEMHSRMKRNAANAYSLNALVPLEPLVDTVIERLIQVLDADYADKERACNLGQYMHFYAMDTIFAITFGKDLQFIENGDRESMLANLQSGLRYMAVAGQIPWIHKFLLGNKLTSYLVSGSNSSETFIDEMLQLATTKTAAAIQNLKPLPPNTPHTFLHHLLLNQKSHPQTLTTREITTHTFGNILAGSDTTSIALSSILTNLLQNPHTYKRLCMELRNPETEKELGFPVAFGPASKLIYLNAVIKEALRIHPSVGLILPRTVPTSGASICDRYHVPAGTEVGINPWIVHRDPEIFPDPDTFKPERWISNTNSNNSSSPSSLEVEGNGREKRGGKEGKQGLESMNRAVFAFGAGAHTCSGKHVSFLEMVKL
ncbi:MAG: hypothetical protein M1834_002686, partial [Cirrosporium novae-zelandiae]